MDREGRGMELMEEVIDHINGNKEEFAGHIEGNLTIQERIKKLREKGWGGEPEIRAISQLANRPVEIWSPGDNGKPTVRKPYVPAPGSLKLAYYPGNHYNALFAERRPQPTTRVTEKEPHYTMASSTSNVNITPKANVMSTDRDHLAQSGGIKRVLSNDRKSGTGR